MIVRKVEAGVTVRTLWWARLMLTSTVLLGLGAAYALSAGFRSEVDRAVAILSRGDVVGLRDYILSFGLWAPAVSALLMVLQALMAPLPAFLLAFANGLAFGALWGGALSLASATLAAAVCFWVARSLGGRPVEALVGKAGLEAADRWLARWGAYAVLLARLVPVISFDVVSYAAGLTHLRFRAFIVATVVGAAPASFAYAYLGEQAPRFVWALSAVFVVVIVVALIVSLMRRRRPAPSQGKENG